MNKAILRVKTPINLLEPVTGELLAEDRPYVLIWTQFFQARVGAGQVEVLEGDLPMEASDEEFARFWAETEGKVDLTIESFKSLFESKEEKPRARAKKAAD